MSSLMSSVTSTRASPASLVPSSTVIGVIRRAELPSSETIGGGVSPAASNSLELIAVRISSIAASS